MSAEAATAAETTHKHRDSTEGITLLEGETVLANVHPSWAHWSGSMILGGIFGLAALAAVAGGNVGAFFGSVLVSGIIFGAVHLARSRSRYIVTDQRVKKKVGLLSTSTGEARIRDIRSLTTEQGFVERLMGKGTVQIDSTGAGGTLGISGVSDHEELAHLIRKQQRKLEEG